MAGVASVSHQTNGQTRNTTWKPVIEEACRDFVDEQLRREPFCTVGLVEEKLHTLESRLNTIERTLVCDPVLLHTCHISRLLSSIV